MFLESVILKERLQTWPLQIEYSKPDSITRRRALARYNIAWGHWPQTKYCFRAKKNTVSLHYAVSLFFKSKWCGSKTSMCPSWRVAPEVLTNLQWPVCVLPSLIAPCISVWCESNHCSERPAGPQRSHTFIITLYCKTFHGHSAPNSLCDKNRAFPLLSFWWFQF